MHAEPPVVKADIVAGRPGMHMTDSKVVSHARETILLVGICRVVYAKPPFAKGDIYC